MLGSSGLVTDVTLWRAGFAEERGALVRALRRCCGLRASWREGVCCVCAVSQPCFFLAHHQRRRTDCQQPNTKPTKRPKQHTQTIHTRTTHTINPQTLPPPPTSGLWSQNQEVKINDLVRGEVAWNTDTLGDFVVLRSNGMPVYNFCVAVDDALMGITHVLR